MGIEVFPCILCTITGCQQRGRGNLKTQIDWQKFFKGHQGVCQHETRFLENKPETPSWKPGLSMCKVALLSSVALVICPSGRRTPGALMWVDSEMDPGLPQEQKKPSQHGKSMQSLCQTWDDTIRVVIVVNCKKLNPLLSSSAAIQQEAKLHFGFPVSSLELCWVVGKIIFSLSCLILIPAPNSPLLCKGSKNIYTFSIASQTTQENDAPGLSATPVANMCVFCKAKQARCHFWYPPVG